ncbi:UDP-N-acetylglucosamine 1-carboxyvinyltransferase [Candidatus Aerophobetes bacterium]|uniref:UDP-N-acetylglucosamine 1-carboxyvinyltransferase n=1 Tax=Aerophobetes bacterium TaxID=2030807 RepID=A0A662D7A4_UNCAE|nr:MAG: UDP-N-acetylglucosamine 1-carboxyvinyltransferase [Candidatus Aerophobetes bacterium]
MDKFVIEGGTPLRGKVKVSGAKNAALPLMVACLLTEGKCQLENIPHLADITTMKKMLEGLGVEIEEKNGMLEVNSVPLFKYEAPYDLVRMMRASILLLGPLLARLRYARISLPGGCNIGRRPIDLHLKGLSQMGAQIEVKGNYIEARARKGLKGENIYLDLPSVGATENIMLAASLAKGKTIIKGASRAPEIVDLANLLRKMGGKIKGAGTNLIEIEGVRELHPVKYSIIPDRIEAGTLLIAGAITKGDVTVEEARFDHLKTFLEKLNEMKIEVDVMENALRVNGGDTFRPVNIKTLPYPGFPTDLQPQLTALACLVQGTSTIIETIFETRFAHISELQRMGAQVVKKESKVLIKGVPLLKGTTVKAFDIRGGAALVLAGLAAEGKTEVLCIHHIDRGYEKLEEKLSKLGAKIKRVKE